MKNILSYIRKTEYRRIFYPLIFLLVALIILAFLPITEYARVDSVSEFDSLSSALNLGSTYVKTPAKNLYYTGEDYYVDNVLVGHYYYELSDNYCRFYILKPAAGKPADPYIAEATITGKVVKMNQGSESILGKFAETLGWSSEGLSSISDPYLVNEVVYFPTYEKVLFGLIVILIIFGLIGFFYILILMIFPKLSKTYRRLHKYGNPDSILEDVEKELTKDVIFKKRSVALTPKYLISYSAEQSAIIPLESVLWVFTLQNLKYSFKARREMMHYTLRIVTITGDAFMIRDLAKEDLDQILTLLEEHYPNFFYDYSEEHDRMVRYILRENKKELQREKK